MDSPDREYTEKYIKSLKVEVEKLKDESHVCLVALQDRARVYEALRKEVETLKADYLLLSDDYKQLVLDVERLRTDKIEMCDDYVELVTIEKQLREALKKTRVYLEERGIRNRGVVGRTQILPMIDEALKGDEGGS